LALGLFGAVGVFVAVVSEVKRRKQERAMEQLQSQVEQQSGSINSLHLASKIDEWGIEDLVEHRPDDNVIRSAIDGCEEIHITCQVDSADWVEHFAKEIRAFLKYGDRLVLNVPDLTRKEVRRELGMDGRFNEDRISELERLTMDFARLQADPAFGSKVILNRLPRCPAYSSVLFIHRNPAASIGYIRLYAHRMHLAHDLPSVHFRHGGRLWRFVEEDLVNVEPR